LLAFLFSLFLLQPVSETHILGIRVGGLLMTLVFVGSVLAVSQRRAMFVVAILLAIPGLVLNLMRPGAAVGSGLHLVADGLVISLFFLVCVCIVIELFSEQQVGLGSVSAALCIYLLIGLAFAFVYDVIERVEPGSFQGLPLGYATVDGNMSGLMYYSFVTLTTLGYGDVTPLTQTAHTFAMLEALLGQVVLVVLVARLVGMQVASAVLPRDGGTGDGGTGSGTA